MVNEWHKEQLENAVERVKNTVKAYFPDDGDLYYAVCLLECRVRAVEYEKYDPL